MKKILSLVLLPFIVLVITEVFFGIAFFIKDVRHQLIHLENTIDYPYLYFSFKPDDKVHFTNEDGLFTDKERNKESDKYRVILVGGSVVRGSLSDRNKTIASYLEKGLNNSFQGDVIEVVNAGMHGYTIEQEFIFIQLMLQHYNPDMIIGIDGYNDLMSFKLNRHADFPATPQNWRDFKVIQSGKDKQKSYYRFKVLFKNTFRATDFVTRLIKRQNIYDYSGVTEVRLEEVSGLYLTVLDDIRDFCNAKDIRFYTFLQPIKWYAPNTAQHVRLNGIPELCRLYEKYDEKTIQLPYGFSLTDIFENNLDVYIDDCHVHPSDNLIFAKAIGDVIKNRLAEDDKLQGILDRKMRKEPK